MSAVSSSPLAPESALHALRVPGDFLDCYAARLHPDRDGQPVEALAREMFSALPGWARLLMRMRDAAVAPLGLKTSRELAARAGPARIGVFPLLSSGPAEVVMGADDAHLDFRAAVIRPAGAPGTVQLATWVRRRNRLGRVYLATILPFHVLIVRACLSRLSQPA
ncbi:MAG: DUF2867 domain-containing protein [Pseudomonadota bacterium]|nr:DUF2867 domain-containing protein [Pseudomonadota bacterium]